MQKTFTAGRDPGASSALSAPLRLEHVFSDPPERVFGTLVTIRQHPQFVPNCHGIRVLGATPTGFGREVHVEYALASKQFNFRRQCPATLRIDRRRRQIALTASFGSGDFTAVIDVSSLADGGTALRAVVRYPPSRGVLRFVPMRPFIRRSFTKTMQSIGRHLDRQRVAERNATEEARPTPVSIPPNIV
jgi:hypothetical protein